MKDEKIKLSKRFKVIIFLLLIISFFVFFFTQDVKAISIPLTIKEKAGVNRNSEPVTSGVPFPKGMLFSEQNLSIQETPAQFQTLTKWDDGSIKWLLIDFQADVEANGEKIYHLVDSHGNTQNSPLKTIESDEDIIVITGPLKVIISKHSFNLFNQVWIDKNNDQSFSEDEKIVQDQSTNGIIITDENGKEYYSSFGTPSSVVIEEEGPMRVGVKIKGRHQTTDNTTFLEYTVRMHFYAHKSFVKVFYTLENNRSNGYGSGGKHTANITSLYINQSVNLSGSKTVSYERYSDNFSNSVSYELYQYWKGWINKNEQNENFEYVIKKNTATVTTGVRTNGYTDLSDNTRGLTIGIRDFWQNFPMRMKVDGDRIQIGLLPEDVSSELIYWSQHTDEGHIGSCNSGKWFLNGGKHKTYEILFYFHLGNALVSKSGEIVKGVNFPLFAKASGSWFAQSGALGYPFVEERNWNNPDNIDASLSSVFNRYERMQSSKWNPDEVDPQPGNERVTLERLKERGGTFGGRQDYGWGNFGDISWAHGHSSLHYDWPYGMLFQFVRTGEYEFFHLGAQMTKHRYDIDQYHTNEDKETFSYGQEFEKSSHHADYYIPRPSHTWVEGLLLYYVLTGDRKALESANENGTFYINNFGRNGEWDGYWGIRIPGWAIEGLTALYQYTGERRYLDFAGKLIINGILVQEQNNGGKGYVLNPGASPPTADPWQQCIAINAMAKYYFETNKANNEIRELIIRMVDWLKTTIAGGVGAPESYTPYSASYEWKPGQTDLGGNIFHLSFHIDPFAWAYLITQDTNYLNFARKLFVDLMNYYEWEKGTTVNKNNPNDLSVISMRSFKFPNTESKIHSSFLRNMKVYMYAETTSSLTEGGSIEGIISLTIPQNQLAAQTLLGIEIKILGTHTTALTNQRGYFKINNFPPGTYTLIVDPPGSSRGTWSEIVVTRKETTTLGTLTLLAGDANNDGKVNNDDFITLCEAFGSMINTPKWNQEVDFNRDNKVNIFDFYILRVNFEKIQKVKFEDLSKLLPIFSISPTATIYTSPMSKEVELGDTFMVDIKVDNVSNLVGAECYLLFNPNLLEVIDDNLADSDIQINLTSFLPNKLMNQVDNVEGKIKFAIGSLNKDESVSGNRTLSSISFRAKSKGEMRLTFTFNPQINQNTTLIDTLGREIPLKILTDFKDTQFNPFPYPNPAKENVTFTGLTPNSKIRVFNILGELVWEENSLNGEDIFWILSNKKIASAIYIYVITNDKGKIKRGTMGIVK